VNDGESLIGIVGTVLKSTESTDSSYVTFFLELGLSSTIEVLAFIKFLNEGFY